MPLPHRRASPHPDPPPYLLLSLFQNHPMLAFHSLRDPTQISQPHFVVTFPRGPPISVPASRNRAGPSRPCLCPTAGLAQTPTHPTPSPSYTHRKSLNTPDSYLLGKKNELDKREFKISRTFLKIKSFIKTFNFHFP